MIKGNIWSKVAGLVSSKKGPVARFEELISLPMFKWVNFGEGIEARIIPCMLTGHICIECEMERGSILDRHGHDYKEGFVVLEGSVKDNVSGLIMKADGRLHKWSVGSEHEPFALEDSKILIYCQL